MLKYNIITTVDIEQQTPDGPVIIQADSVVNTILWDGETEYTPPENTVIKLVDNSISPA